MNREESIELARDLNREYESAEQLSEKIREYERKLVKPADTYKEKRSLFYYYKSYIKASVITILLLLLPAHIVSGIAEFLAQSYHNHSHIAFMMPFLFLAIAIVLINAAGVLISKRKLKDFYLSEDERIREELELRDTWKHELSDLMAQFEDLSGKLDKYNDLVPDEFQTQRHMKRVEDLLLTNKADSFEAAISLLEGQERT